MFSERYSIDLVPNLLQWSKVIMSMDCMGPNGTMIDCRFHFYVMDTCEEGNKTLDDVPIVRELPDVFSEDFLGVPPKR